MIVTANSGVTVDVERHNRRRCQAGRQLSPHQLVLGNNDANMHHQLNDATDTVSASCTISTSVKPEPRRGWKDDARST
jgi:hypothetical protein